MGFPEGRVSLFEASLLAAQDANARITEELERRALDKQWNDVDAARLLREVIRLRRWLVYAAEHMSYECVEERLWRSLTDEALAFSEDVPLRWQE